MNPILIEGTQSGGQLMITTEVENYPGFPKGIMGPDLMLAMRGQAERFGARILSGTVTKVELKRRPFKIVTDNSEYVGETVIVATGASARWLDIPTEKLLYGKGVSACATCDGFFFKDQDVVVVGGGDTAIEEAIYLANLARSVKIIHRRDELRASKAMQTKVNANPKISFIWDSVVQEIKDIKQNKVTGVVLKNVKEGKIKEVSCQGVFVAIGHEPNTSIFKGQLKLNDKGYIVTEKGTSKTNVEGVFAAGDVADPVYRQAVTAAGSGCQAAIDAERFLSAVS